MLKIDRTTASRAVSNLVKNGFVEKIADDDNKKNKLLYATEKGQALYPLIIRENEHSNKVALNHFQKQKLQN